MVAGRRWWAPRHPSWFVALMAAALLALSSLVIVQGMATALRNSRPDDALRLMPTDARALATRASQTLLVPRLTRAGVAEARASAMAALAQDATLPQAWRTLGLTEPENSDRYLSAMRFSEALSRRDALTQIALLENEVGRGSIERAMHHYDIILRISTAYDGVLFPVLAAAMDDPEIREPGARLLMNAPLWRRRFLSYLVNSGTSYTAQADLFAALRRAGPLADRDIVAASAANSINVGQYDAAQRLYAMIAPEDARRLLRNGEFDQDDGVPPFDWQLVTDGTLNVAITGGGGSRRLEISSVRGDGARAARQFLMLQPRRYRLQAQSGAIAGEVVGLPYMSVACVSGAPIATFDGARGGKRFGGVVTVPPGCSRQWLDVGMRQDANGAPTALWIDGVALGPAL